MAMIQEILSIKKDDSVLWQFGKNKKEVIQETIDAFDGLCMARAYLPNYTLEDTLGIPHRWVLKNKTIGLSVNQMQHYIRYVAKKGKTLKRPYNLPNTEITRAS